MLFCVCGVFFLASISLRIWWRCYWLKNEVNCGTLGHFQKFKPVLVFVLLFILNCMFIFCRQNTLRDAGLTYFVHEFSKPMSSRFEG